MSDYRRLISYIYEYEGKAKGKNIGFVKLEARNGQCRLNVNVKRVYVGGNAIGVYLLGRGGKETFLGNMFVRNGTGEFRATVDAENVEETGDRMDTYYGLTVHDVKNSWRSYRTVWEDVETLEAAELSAERSKDGGSIEAKSEESVQPAEIGEVQASTENTEPGENRELVENMESAETRESAVDMKSVENRVSVENRKPSENTEPAENADKRTEKMSERESVETGMQFQAQDILPGSDQKNCTLDVETSVESLMISPELENPEVLRYLQETEKQPANPDALWQELRKTYPKICPFDYDGGCEVLTICPDDIGRLPRECWIYGNNSFLLHGYYNFRYLILVRMNQINGPVRYLLGVPGHYYSNEKYMATMFGFPNFVLSKKQPPNDGRFGYWYTDIKMH